MKTKLHCGILKLALFIGLFFVVSNANGQITFTSWTYEPINGTSSNPTPNTGSGSSSIVNLGGGTVTPGSRTGMKPGTPNFGCGSQDGVTAWAFEPFDPGTANESNGAQFNSSTSGYENIKFVWDQRSSNTTANTVRVQYTLDGSSWINFNMNGSNTVFCNGSINGNGCFEANSTGDAYRRTAVDFSSITAASNNPNFGVRILAAYYQSTTEFRQVSAPGSTANPGGTWRFDNVSFTGTLLLGPTSSVMSGNGTTCAGSTSNSIIVTIAGGTSPFTLQYTDNISGSIVTLNNYVSGSPISVTPTASSGNVIYSIVSVANAGNGAVGTGNSGNGVIAVNPQPSLPASASNLLSFTSCSPAAFPAGSPANYSNATETGAYYDAATNLAITIPYTGPSINFYFRVTTIATGCYKNSTTYTYVKKDLIAGVTLSSTAPQTVCQGDSFSSITATYTGIATSFQWVRRLAVSPFTQVILSCGSFCTEVANGSTTLTYTPLSTGAAYPVGTSYQYYIRVTGACNTSSSGFSGVFSVTAPTVAGTVSSAQTICAGTAPSNLTLSGHSGLVLKWQKADDIGFTTNVVDFANTTTTLTSAEIGTLSQTTYFRAFLQKNSCSIKTTTPIQVLIKSTTWTILPAPPAHWSAGVPDSSTTAIFDTDYSSAGNLSACSVLVNSGNVVFNTNHTLTIQNGLTVSGGTMTFENNASLLQVNNAVNSGAITYKRQTSNAVTNFDYTYWSTPVSPQTLSNFSPMTLSDKYFWMNPIPYVWEAVAVPGLTNMTPGQGYIIRGPQGNVTASVWEGLFVGVPNNGDVTPQIAGLNSVVYTDPTHNLNCLGNPYPSAVSADLLMSGNPATLGTGTTLYFWTHNTPITNGLYTFNDYALYNYSGGTGTIKAPSPGANTNIPNGKIAAGQGFMIKAISTGAVTFRNSMRLGGATDNNQFYKTNRQDSGLTNLERNRVWLELENGQGAYRQILIGYIENATNDFENGYDGEALEAGNPVRMYSLVGDKKLAIQGRALPFDIMDQVAIGFKSPAAGTYTINLSNYDGLFSNADAAVYLEDKLQNITHNLKMGAYSFATESGTFDTRFVLRFSAPLKVTDNLLNPQAVILFKEQHQIKINSGNNNMTGVQIFDITGRLLYENKIINNSEVAIESSFANEVLIVKIKFPDNREIVRKFLN